MATAKAKQATAKAKQASSMWEKVPQGHPNMSATSDINSCPWLSQNPDEAESKYPPSNGGVVPNSVFFAIGLDITAVGLIIPLLSRYAKGLGGGPAFTGLLSTVYGLMQLIGASLLGNLSDKRGRKLVLLMSMIGAFTGYFTLYLAVGWFHSLALLFLSRMPIGLCKQTMCVSRAVISDCTTRADRMKMMSRLGAAAGLGFVIGPMTGGILSAIYDELLPPKISCCLYLVAMFVVWNFVPETAPLLQTREETAKLLQTASALYEKDFGSSSATIDVTQAIAFVKKMVDEFQPNAVRLTSMERTVLVDKSRAFLSQPSAAFAVSAADGGDKDKTAKTTTTFKGVCGCIVSLYYICKEEKGLLVSDDSAKDDKAKNDEESFSGLVSKIAARFLIAKKYPLLGKVLLCRALVDISFMMIHTTFPFYTQERFGMDAKGTGFVLAYVGVLSVFTDIVVAPYLAKQNIGELRMALGGALTVGVALAASALAQSLKPFLAGMAVLALGTSLFKSTINTILTQLVEKTEIGAASGSLDAAESCCRILAPLLGGLLMQYIALPAPGLVGGVLCSVGAFGLHYFVPPQTQTETPTQTKQAGYDFQAPSKAKAEGAEETKKLQ